MRISRYGNIDTVWDKKIRNGPEDANHLIWWNKHSYILRSKCGNIKKGMILISNILDANCKWFATGSASSTGGDRLELYRGTHRLFPSSPSPPPPPSPFLPPPSISVRSPPPHSEAILELFKIKSCPKIKRNASICIKIVLFTKIISVFGCAQNNFFPK